MTGSPSDDWPGQLTTRSVTLVVVAHNDALGLPPTIDRVYRALSVTAEEFEILIFDDGSSDDTPNVAQALAGRYAELKVVRFDARMGVGHCLAVGCRQAKSNFVVYVPADNTWPQRSYVELFGNIGKADVITSYSGNLLTSIPLWRRLISRTYTMVLNSVFGFGLHYYNGLAVYPAAFLRSITPTSTGFGFQAEALIRALASGYSFLEVGLPVDDANALRSRSITGRNILDAISMVIVLGTRFYFFPSTIRGRRFSSGQVRRGPSVDELGVSGRLERFRSPASGLKDLRIAIIGASSGIGAELARAFAKDGHRLFICARRSDRLHNIARQMPTVRAIPCDITNEREVAAFFSAIDADAGALDVLINCAGAFGEIGPVASTDSNKWWETVRLNVFGPYLTIKHSLPLLEKGRKPRIVNISGGGAFSPFPNYSAYACSKAALVRLTECLAIELQPRNIRVNAVSPGIVATDIHKATLSAGEHRAGRQQYRRTLSVMADGGPPLDEMVECVRALLSPPYDRLTGKTISANFDPWQTETFISHIDDITSSDLYTLRRLNLANLNDGYLRKSLSEAWANFGSDI